MSSPSRRLIPQSCSTLVILPCKPHHTFYSSFADFANLFPKIESLAIHWSFFEQHDFRLPRLQHSASQQKPIVLPTSLSSIHIRTLDVEQSYSYRYENLDEEHVKQLLWLLQQFQCPGLHHLHLDMGSFIALRIAESQLLSEHLNQALGPFHVHTSRHLRGRIILNMWRKCEELCIPEEI